MDYGSQVLLASLEQAPIYGKVLDLGCGYGPIGIVIKTLFPDVEMTSCDINPRAVELTKINAGKNHVTLEALQSDGFTNINDMFDIVITNPPIRAGKAVIYKMFDDAYAHLKDSGCLYVVIRKAQGAESAIKKLKDTFGNCEIINRKSGYWVLKSTH